MRHRTWIYTSYDDEKPLQPTDTLHHTVQREICPTTGRQHWQGVIRLQHAKTLSAIKKALGTHSIHLEPCRNFEKAKQYCSKEETRAPNTTTYTFNQEEQENWWQNLSTNELWTQHPTWMLRHHIGVAAYQKTLQPPPNPRKTPKVFVLWGPPGSGKSWSARNYKPEYFAKASGPWWDGYQGQETVIFDDFYGDEKLSDMLRWLSELPLRVPIKGSTLPLKATTFFITSNTEYTKWYKHTDALARRITHTIYCTEEVYYIQKKPN